MKTKSKFSNNYKFSKNFFMALIAPIVAVVLAVVFGLTLGFNKGIDFSGGVLVSVVAGTETNLYENDAYNQFKNRLDSVLEGNGLYGQVYSVEINNMQEYTLVVKMSYSNQISEEILQDVKSDLKTEFYPSLSLDDLDNGNYIIVSEFGSSVDNRVFVTTALATIVCALLVCIYIFFRMGLNASVISFVSAVFNNIFALAIVMIARVQITYASIIIVPFVTIASLLYSFIFVRKARNLLKTTEKYDRQNNFVLADDTTKQTLKQQTIIASVIAVGSIVLGLFNVCNSVLFVSLAVFTAIACVLYTNVLLLPGLFARTFVRKIKKSKPQKTDSTQTSSLDEKVLEETDLDNLVSN